MEFVGSSVTPEVVAQSYLAVRQDEGWAAKVLRQYADGTRQESEFVPRKSLREALLDIEAAVSDDTYVELRS